MKANWTTRRTKVETRWNPLGSLGSTIVNSTLAPVKMTTITPIANSRLLID